MPRARANSVSTRSSFLMSAGLADLVDDGNEYGTGQLSGNHFRCEISTGLWSLHCPQKYNPRPKGYTPANAGKDRTHERPNTRRQGNPFDLENSHMTPPIIYTISDPADTSRPLVRVFENKFPVLTKPEQPGQGEVRVSFVDNFFAQVSAIGLHEVVVQHWRYNMCEALMTSREVKLLWKALKHRFDYLSGISRFVQLLENHGVRSGGSLPHPHSQLLGLPVVPSEQTGRYNVALAYWRKNDGECVFDAVLDTILAAAGKGGKADRMLMQNEHMVAFVPHAQERKNEMWIMPRRQCHSFAEVTKEEVGALALACRSCLKMLYACLDDPDYNILMRTSPANTSDQLGDEHTEPMALWYRWHLVIIPHDNEWAWGGIKGLGGFTEVQGTPEQHAAELREYSTTLLTTSSRLDEIDEQAPAPVPEEQQPKARSVRFDQVRQMYCLFRYFPGCTAKRSRGISADWSYPLVWCAI
jgi:UDPglucose--hexose-1-phosphate uridylyltransferase